MLLPVWILRTGLQRSRRIVKLMLPFEELTYGWSILEVKLTFGGLDG
jgi:hypothetical protein